MTEVSPVKVALAKQFATGRQFTLNDLRFRTGYREDEIQTALRSMAALGLVHGRQKHKMPTIWERRA